MFALRQSLSTFGSRWCCYFGTGTAKGVTSISKRTPGKGKGGYKIPSATPTTKTFPEFISAVRDRVDRGFWLDKNNIMAVALKCSSRTQLRDKYPGAYYTAWRQGWLNDISGHMRPMFMKVPRGHWNIKENCLKEAVKYTGRKAFQKGCAGADNSITKHGWVKDLHNAVEGIWKSVPRGDWKDKEVCRQEALKYLTRQKFRKGNVGAYKSTVKNGWMDEFLPMSRAPYRTWNDVDKLHAEALKYETRTAFMKGSTGAYHAARAKGLLEELCTHMKVLKMRTALWTKALCAEEVLKYTSQEEVLKSSPRLYKALVKNGWMLSLGKHLVKAPAPTFDKGGGQQKK